MLHQFPHVICIYVYPSNSCWWFWLGTTLYLACPRGLWSGRVWSCRSACRQARRLAACTLLVYTPQVLVGGDGCGGVGGVGERVATCVFAERAQCTMSLCLEMCFMCMCVVFVIFGLFRNRCVRFCFRCCVSVLVLCYRLWMALGVTRVV